MIILETNPAWTAYYKRNLERIPQKIEKLNKFDSFYWKKYLILSQKYYRCAAKLGIEKNKLKSF